MARRPAPQPRSREPCARSPEARPAFALEGILLGRALFEGKSDLPVRSALPREGDPLAPSQEGCWQRSAPEFAWTSVGQARLHRVAARGSTRWKHRPLVRVQRAEREAHSESHREGISRPPRSFHPDLFVTLVSDRHWSSTLLVDTPSRREGVAESLCLLALLKARVVGDGCVWGLS